jgi:hypothetical protein
MLLVTPLWVAVVGRLVMRDAAQHPRQVHSGAFLYGVAFLMLLVSFGRGVVTGSLSLGEAAEQVVIWTSVTALLLSWLLPYPPTSPERLVAGVLTGAGLLTGLNVALYWAGVRNPTTLEQTEGMQARVLALFGVEVDRAAFPFGSGLNGFGAFAGAVFVATFVFLTRSATSTGPRVRHLILLTVSAYVMLAVDSRATVLLAPVCGLFGAVAPTGILKRIRWLAVVVPALPAAVATGAALAAGADLGIQVARSADDLISAGKRLFVWSSIAEEYAASNPIHIVGFGFYGQTASGIVDRYQSIVGVGYVEERLTAHNGTLQYLLDTGYVGVALFLVILWTALGCAGAALVGPHCGAARVTASVLAYLALIGTTEAIPTPYHRETLYLFLGFSVAALSMCRAERRPTISSGASEQTGEGGLRPEPNPETG